MVELLRVDERLLHGQVAVTWANAVAPDAILVANDDAATNEMSKLALKMAKPNSVKLAVKTIADGAALLNNPNAEKIKIFVIVRTLDDALKLVSMCKHIHRVNIGGVKKKEGGKMLAPNIFLNESDLEQLRTLYKIVDEVEVRMVPSESKTDIEKLLK